MATITVLLLVGGVRQVRRVAQGPAQRTSQLEQDRVADDLIAGGNQRRCWLGFRKEKLEGRVCGDKR